MNILKSAEREYKKNNYMKAIELYSSYIAKNIDSTEVYQKRADVYFMIKDYTAALNDLNFAISIEPDNSSLYYERSLVYTKLKKYKLALADNKTMLKLDSKEHEFNVSLPLKQFRL